MPLEPPVRFTEIVTVPADCVTEYWLPDKARLAVAGGGVRVDGGADDVPVPVWVSDVVPVVGEPVSAVSPPQAVSAAIIAQQEILRRASMFRTATPARFDQGQRIKPCATYNAARINQQYVSDHRLRDEGVRDACIKRLFYRPKTFRGKYVR